MKKIENLLSPQMFDYAYNAVTDLEVPWFYIPYTSVDNKSLLAEEQLNVLPYMGSWNHVTYNRQQQRSALDPILRMILLEGLDKLGLKIDKLYRSRLGFITPSPEKIRHGAHIDMDCPHMTALFYFTTTNGETVLYKNKYDPFSMENGDAYYMKVHDGNLEVEQTSECIANNFIVFDGWQYHSSTSQTDEPKRIAVNFNFTVK